MHHLVHLHGTSHCEGIVNLCSSLTGSSLWLDPRSYGLLVCAVGVCLPKNELKSLLHIAPAITAMSGAIAVNDAMRDRDRTVQQLDGMASIQPGL